MLEAESRLRRGIERAPVGERHVEQDVGAQDIGLDERRGAVDRAVDVALGGEMQHGVGLDLVEDLVDRGAVADVDLEMGVPVAGARLGQRLQIAGVGELVDVGDMPVGVADDVADDRRADEPRAAGDQELHSESLRS